MLDTDEEDTGRVIVVLDVVVGGNMAVEGHNVMVAVGMMFEEEAHSKNVAVVEVVLSDRRRDLVIGEHMCLLVRP